MSASLLLMSSLPPCTVDENIDDWFEQQMSMNMVTKTANTTKTIMKTHMSTTNQTLTIMNIITETIGSIFLSTLRTATGNTQCLTVLTVSAMKNVYR